MDRDNILQLNTVSALNKVFSAPSDLSFFSVSHGHTYHKPVQQSTSQALGGPSQHSKESTPMPETQPSTTEKSTGSSQAHDDTDSGIRTAWDALRMTLQYGKEYMDDMPLAGEPGNFRFSKSKEGTAGQIKPPTTSSTAATPGQSRAASSVPQAPSNPLAGPKASKGEDKALSVSEGAIKAKRRKSKVGELSP